MKYSFRIKEDLLRIIPEIGIEIETKLKGEFPQAIINGDFDPSILTYIITANKIIVCDISGFLILTAAEKQSAYKGEGYFESSRELNEYITSLTNFYLNSAREKIKVSLMEILK